MTYKKQGNYVECIDELYLYSPVEWQETTSDVLY